jgi:RNA polymerase sigma-70 factor (ECF subfamily)
LNDVLRNKSRGNTVEIEDAPSECVSVSAQQETQVHFKDVSRAFELLTASDKHVISLIALKGMAYSEVAEIMNRPVGTIRSRLSRARAKLVASVEMGAKAPRPTMLQAA